MRSPWRAKALTPERNISQMSRCFITPSALTFDTRPSLFRTTARVPTARAKSSKVERRLAHP
eukprot:9924379-Lingulodinium_polyedra.AAC.1